MITIKIAPEKTTNFSFNESYKTLRTNLLWNDEKKVVCFTSSFPGEGKSSVAFNAAMSLAEQDRKVLFIDADMRKSILPNRLGIKQYTEGLSEFLARKRELDSILCKTNVDNLYMIFSGSFPPNPSELLGKDLLVKTINSCKKIFDHIIIDTPPIGSVIDAAIISRSSDGIVMVVEAGKTERKELQRSVQQLEQLNCPIIGFVLNKISKKTDSYYAKYYGKYYTKDM